MTGLTCGGVVLVVQYQVAAPPAIATNAAPPPSATRRESSREAATAFSLAVAALSTFGVIGRLSPGCSTLDRIPKLRASSAIGSTSANRDNAGAPKPRHV